MAKVRKNQIKNIPIAKKQMRKLFQEHNIRECYIRVIRLEEQNKASLKKHGFRECKVILTRLVEPLTSPTPEKKLILKPCKSAVSVRSNVAWLPRIPNRVTFAKETEKLQGRPMKRSRANSMFEERSGNHNDSKPSMAAFHRELLEKRYQLSPVGMRKIQPKIHQETSPVWIQICDEIQKNLDTKKKSKKY